jgi:glycosyltransferase involved in cell wall biosynthesis
MSYDNYLQWTRQPEASRPELSVVIPTYNEAQRIVPTIAAVASHVCDLGRTWELIVSDDGSTDGTADIVLGLDFANVTVLTAERNRGKGAAVRAGIAAARGDLVLFSDADLSTPIEEFDRLLEQVEGAGADIAVGSRAAAGADERSRSGLRLAISKIFRGLSARLFSLGVEDTQCGFKLFRADVARRLIEAQTIEGFSFDLELLWIAHRLGLQVAEVAVDWIDAPGSKVDPVRESLRFLRDMVRIRYLHRRLRPADQAEPGLRVAVVTPHPPSGQTLNEYGYHLVRHLADKPGVSEVVLLCDQTAEGEPRFDGDRVTVDACWRFDDPTNLVRLCRAARRHRPDVVLFNLQFASFGSGKVPAALGLCAPMLLRSFGFPTIVLLHNLVDTVDLDSAGYTSSPKVARILTAIGRGLTRFVLRADRVAVTIPAYVEILQDRYQADNVYLVPHGSFGQSEPADLSVPSRPRLLAFGKFGTYKRVDELIEAYRILRNRGHAGLELVIAGADSPNSPGYLARQEARNADLIDLHFTGYVPEDELAATFTSSTVVVFPYTGTTGSSGPLHQAGEYGRAAVLPRLGDFLELIAEEGFTGEPFEPGDTVSLADAIERLLVDDDRRQEIAARNAAAAAGLPMSEVVDWHLLHLASASKAA